jgi:hypothetical protein
VQHQRSVAPDAGLPERRLREKRIFLSLIAL